MKLESQLESSITKGTVNLVIKRQFSIGAFEFILKIVNKKRKSGNISKTNM